MLNKAQEAAANSGNKTTRSLVSAIKVKFRLQYIKYFLFEYYYTSFITLVFKSKREFFYIELFLGRNLKTIPIHKRFSTTSQIVI